MGKLVPLSVLVAESFAESPSAMWAFALDNHLPVGVDAKGRVGVEASAVDRMRQQRREREAAEAFERERAAAVARQQRQDQEVAALVAQERRQQIRDREQRLEQRVGASRMAIEAEYRRQIWLRPNTGGSLGEIDRIASADISLEDLERFVDDTYGPPDVSA